MAGTLVITTLSDGTNSTSATNPIRGSARAWVNFNGTGTVAIRDSYNVSSITDNGTGDYTVNLTNALPDANGSVTSGGFYFSNFTSTGESIQCALSSTSQVRITTGNTSVKLDFNFVNIAVFD